VSALHRRRAFVKTLTVGSLGVLAAACSPAAPSAGPVAPGATSAPVAAPADTSGAKPPAKRPRLVFGAPRPMFESNDVVRGWDQVVSPMYEMLVGIDENGNFVPQLAEKWQVEPNQKDYRFFLRKGILFQNNMGELTAEDVKLTFDRITAPGQSNNPNAQELRDIIDHIEIINPYEIVFVNKVPDATLPMFCSPALHTAIVSKNDARSGQARRAVEGDRRPGLQPAPGDPVVLAVPGVRGRPQGDRVVRLLGHLGPDLQLGLEHQGRLSAPLNRSSTEKTSEKGLTEP
jgi:ABC-type transport system substrate-binding protein